MSQGRAGELREESTPKRVEKAVGRRGGTLLAVGRRAPGCHVAWSIRLVAFIHQQSNALSSFASFQDEQGTALNACSALYVK